ncbi:MAG: VOC family protein [Flavisolibacter sp.]
MQVPYKIIPHLWYDQQAKEAAKFYCSIFPDSSITNITVLHNTPSGDCDVVSFQLSGQPFMAISAGPIFKFNPSISFIVNFDPAKDREAQEKLNASWKKLSEGGKALMPLGEYPFSKRYGWIQDKFGLSWQLHLANPGAEPRPFIIPALSFVGTVAGKAEEATEYYISVFKNSKRGNILRYPGGMEPHKEGTVMFTDFMIENQWFAAMDSAEQHQFTFNEAVSFLVNCNSQEEIDDYWEKLSALPQSEQCGWCKDQYGLSWQISAAIMGEMMGNGSQQQIDRLTQTFLKMKKIDLKKLKEAYEGEMVNGEW